MYATVKAIGGAIGSRSSTALVVEYVAERGIDYLYSSDTGFDGVGRVARLGTADNPYAPE